jgi:chitin disaccharide deacetylase
LSVLAQSSGDHVAAKAAESASGLRRIWLCADDYGISKSVNAAIRDLIVRGRINATSVMVAAPSFHRTEALALDVLNAGARRVAIGLHVTLTAPFRPLGKSFRPLRNDAFLPLSETLARALLHMLDRNVLAAEITAQVRLFVHTFGRPPDFIDGHQHVQLFPQVRDALLAVAKSDAPNAWVRQCGRPESASAGFADAKALVLDRLSKAFRQRAAELGVRTNPAFAGAYAFGDRADFAALFVRFLDRLPDGGVIMCHPGFVDAELKRLDPLTTLREREHAFLAGAAFPSLLAANGVALA